MSSSGPSGPLVLSFHRAGMGMYLTWVKTAEIQILCAKKNNFMISFINLVELLVILCEN